MGMIPIQMCRMKTKSKHSFPYGIEERFVDGTLPKRPKLGEQILFYYDKLGKGWIQTSPVKEIIPGPDVTIYRTENSEYHVKEGWKDED